MLEVQKDMMEIVSGPPKPGRISRRIGPLALLVAILAAATGIFLRWHQESAVKSWTAEVAVPVVSFVIPQRGGSASRLSLPGEIQAWFDAPIYARVSGYLKKWYFDFGAHVKAGDLLAEIDAPDLDASFAAAKARLANAKAVVNVREAELEFARTTYQRWRTSPKGVVSVQETLAKKGDFESAAARLNAATAEVDVAQGEVDRRAAMEGFKRVVAPFAGVVTERNTDIGALINSGSGAGGGSAPVLFRVADLHAVRIFVQVPQRMSANIREGLRAELRLPQFPEKTFEATVATTSNAINQSARTLLVELHADNPDGLLQPGSYAEVDFSLPDNPDLLTLPTSTLVFRRHGLEVAVVSADNRIIVKKITIGRNLGSRVEVETGLSPTDRVVVSPPDSLAPGDLVRIAGQASRNAKGPGTEADAEMKLPPSGKPAGQPE